jgi:hypothetical protein
VLLAVTRDDDPEAFARCEDALVEAARTLRPRELRLAIDRWRLSVDAERAEQAERRRFERRALYVSPTLDGMVRLDGDLDPETGQVVLTAIRSILDADARGADGDGRRPAQRRADALGEICRTYLDSADRPTVAGERPHSRCRWTSKRCDRVAAWASTRTPRRSAWPRRGASRATPPFRASC